MSALDEFAQEEKERKRTDLGFQVPRWKSTLGTVGSKEGGVSCIQRGHRGSSWDLGGAASKYYPRDIQNQARDKAQTSNTDRIVSFIADKAGATHREVSFMPSRLDPDSPTPPSPGHRLLLPPSELNTLAFEPELLGLVPGF